ncbi:DUF192 domain-containing protein [Streptomyces sp. F63]|uniref:DUF192 domain-containing protein n=1 Tax=Streptomyces sp. F63 TaxID=2824887 RepID=UPI0035B07C73
MTPASTSATTATTSAPAPAAPADGGNGAGTGGAADGRADAEAGRRPAGRTVRLEVAASLRARTRGLLGRDGVEGAILLTPANSVHTFRMRFPIDVAYLSRDFRVLDVRTMRPGQLGRPRLRARHVLEAEAGAMRDWGLVRGARVRIG